MSIFGKIKDAIFGHKTARADPASRPQIGYTGAKDGSAEMNIWLHKEVMRQLAANGGKVPSSMTD
jgi:hypothetical protein